MRLEAAEIVECDQTICGSQRIEQLKNEIQLQLNPEDHEDRHIVELLVPAQLDAFYDTRGLFEVTGSTCPSDTGSLKREWTK